MDINKKYYLQLRDLLGSEYVLGIYNDEEVIDKLIRLVSVGTGFKQRVRELEEEVEDLEVEVRSLEQENKYLRDELAEYE